MARNPSNFFDTIQDKIAKERAESEKDYQYKILSRYLIKIFDLDRLLIDRLYSDFTLKDPLVELKYSIADPDFDNMFIKKLKNISLLNLLKSVKCRAYAEYGKIYDELGLDRMAFIFPVKGEGSWIIHTFPGLRVSGDVYHLIPSGHPDLADLEICKLETFIRNYRRKKSECERE